MLLVGNVGLKTKEPIRSARRKFFVMTYEIERMLKRGWQTRRHTRYFRKGPPDSWLELPTSYPQNHSTGDMACFAMKSYGSQMRTKRTPLHQLTIFFQDKSTVSQQKCINLCSVQLSLLADENHILFTSQMDTKLPLA